MKRKAMSLKAKIRNLARKKETPAQVVLQNYMFERFLERLSVSTYKDKFILKGGVLIAALVGIENRSTMDIDATIKNYPIDTESLTKAISEICSITIDDDVSFSFSGIEVTREDDVYGGYRVSVISNCDTIITPLQIDITVGDVITPKEVFYAFKMLLGKGSFGAWAYNIETVLAEKVETILRRGQLNTRPRDFYDVYALAKTQNIEQSVFSEALRSTAIHRETAHIFDNIDDRLKEISASENLRSRWIKYTKDYSYAEGIDYDDILVVIRALIKDLV